MTVAVPIAPQATEIFTIQADANHIVLFKHVIVTCQAHHHTDRNLGYYRRHFSRRTNVQAGSAGEVREGGVKTRDAIIVRESKSYRKYRGTRARDIPTQTDPIERPCFERILFGVMIGVGKSGRSVASRQHEAGVMGRSIGVPKDDRGQVREHAVQQVHGRGLGGLRVISSSER
jgi:hypothetical protein